MKSVLKKCTIAAVSTALAVTGLGVMASMADATPPSGVNIVGQEEFDTNAFMDRICGDMRKGGENDDNELKAFFYNIHTGEVREPDEYEEPVFTLVPGESKQIHTGRWPRGYHYALSPGWEHFRGNCEFPQSDTWTSYDKEQPITKDTEKNCTSRDASYSLRESYATSSTFTKTVGGSVRADFALVKEIFTVGASGEFSFSWAVTKTHSLDRIVTINVAPGKIGRINAEPLKRTVRVHPVFHINDYEYGDGQVEFGFGTRSRDWRGRGYDRIWSDGFHVEGTADELNTDGSPAMQFVTREEDADCDED
jgi:hypothetical protein